MRWYAGTIMGLPSAQMSKQLELDSLGSLRFEAKDHEDLKIPFVLSVKS